MTRPAWWDAACDAEWQALHPGRRRATAAEVAALIAELDARQPWAHARAPDPGPSRWTRDRMKGAAGD